MIDEPVLKTVEDRVVHDFLGRLAERGGTAEALRVVLADLGLSLVPTAATDGLLVSMALRQDHAFLAPRVEGDPFSEMLSLGEGERRARLTTLRQIHEEVVGTGFHSARRDAAYAASMPSS